MSDERVRRQGDAAHEPPEPPRLLPVAFARLPFWQTDDHAHAFSAFLRSAARYAALDGGEAGAGVAAPSSIALDVYRQARQRGRRRISRAEARYFFEHYFVPHRVLAEPTDSLLTGYFEPLLAASTKKTRRFTAPLYRRPHDLVEVRRTQTQAPVVAGRTYMRRTPRGLEPYPTRADIEAGALAGRGLELAWVEDPVDAFIIQIQGSAALRMSDGRLMRVAYDGSNGHPYTSVGRLLLARGGFSAHGLTLAALIDYLRADRARATQLMQHNRSFVFFRAQGTADEPGHALGADDIPLTPGRSLAVDPSYHGLGLPIYVSAPRLRTGPGAASRHRLMVAQDVGAAIKGPGRADWYVGTGPEAGRVAGAINHPATFYRLVPRCK